jgi:hypothetical protein
MKTILSILFVTFSIANYAIADDVKKVTIEGQFGPMNTCDAPYSTLKKSLNIRGLRLDGKISGTNEKISVCANILAADYSNGASPYSLINESKETFFVSGTFIPEFHGDLTLEDSIIVEEIAGK